MLKHRANCVYNYDTTSEVLKLIKSWMSSASHIHTGFLSSKRDTQRQNGAGSIYYYEMDAETRFETSGQERTNKQPTKKYYPDPEGKHRCVICDKPYKRAQDVTTHRTTMKRHEEKRTKVTATTMVDVILQKKEGDTRLTTKGVVGR